MEQIRCVGRILYSASLRSFSPHSCKFGTWGINPFSPVRLLPFIHLLASAVPGLTLSAFSKGFGRTLRVHSHFCLCIWFPNPLFHYQTESRFLGALSVTSVYLTKYLMQRNWTRFGPLMGGSCRSFGLQSSAGIQNYPEEPEEQNIPQKSCQTVSSVSQLGCVLGLAALLLIPLLLSSIRALASPGGSLLLQGHALKTGTHPHVLGSAPSCNKSKSTPDLPLGKFQAPHQPPT